MYKCSDPTAPRRHAHFNNHRLCELWPRNSFKDVHLQRFVARSNMSSSQRKRPVSLLGTNSFGSKADKEQSLEMVKTFLDRGHVLLDTAIMYADGKAETYREHESS